MRLSEFKLSAEQNQSKEQPKKEQEQKVEDLYNTYKDMNSTELMQELFKNVQKSKQDGSFDFLKLSESVKQILPYLSQEQQNSVMSILNQIK